MWSLEVRNRALLASLTMKATVVSGKQTHLLQRAKRGVFRHVPPRPPSSRITSQAGPVEGGRRSSAKSNGYASVTNLPQNNVQQSVDGSVLFRDAFLQQTGGRLARLLEQLTLPKEIKKVLERKALIHPICNLVRLWLELNLPIAWVSRYSRCCPEPQLGSAHPCSPCSMPWRPMFWQLFLQLER